MKVFALIVLLFSLNSLADETCKTSRNRFRITGSYIEARGLGVNFRLPFQRVQTVTKYDSREFRDLINIFRDELETDYILTAAEINRVQRFVLTVTFRKIHSGDMMYAKGYDKFGQLMVRYMVTSNGAYRCL